MCPEMGKYQYCSASRVRPLFPESTVDVIGRMLKRSGGRLTWTCGMDKLDSQLGLGANKLEYLEGFKKIEVLAAAKEKPP